MRCNEKGKKATSEKIPGLFTLKIIQKTFINCACRPSAFYVTFSPLLNAASLSAPFCKEHNKLFLKTNMLKHLPTKRKKTENVKRISREKNSNETQKKNIPRQMMCQRNSFGHKLTANKSILSSFELSRNRTIDGRPKVELFQTHTMCEREKSIEK